MGRRLIQVDLSLLKQSIAKAEENGPLRTQNDVWIKAAEIYNTLPAIPEKITFSVVFLRAKENNIEIKTQSARGKGKKASQSGITSPSQRPQTAPERISPFPETGTQEKTKSPINTSFEVMEKRTPERFSSLADAVRKGSKKAAIKLHCLECCGYATNEVKNCTGLGCALYSFRPYQEKEKPAEIVQPAIISPEKKEIIVEIEQTPVEVEQAF